MYGARLKVKDGQDVKQGLLLVEWDPYSFTIMTEEDGQATFKDILDGQTVHEQVDENTGMSTLIIIESPDEKKQPRIEVRDGKGKILRKYLLPSGAHLGRGRAGHLGRRRAGQDPARDRQGPARPNGGHAAPACSPASARQEDYGASDFRYRSCGELSRLCGTAPASTRGVTNCGSTRQPSSKRSSRIKASFGATTAGLSPMAHASSIVGAPAGFSPAVGEGGQTCSQ